MPQLQAVVGWLHYCRTQRRLTQMQLQKMSGIARTYISSLEAGRFAPGLVMLECVVRGLGMTSADFFTKGTVTIGGPASASEVAG